jgi:hypothetical protein
MIFLARRFHLLALALFLSILTVYLATSATGIIPGDPTEYTFVAHVLGIGHPPGYALMTLLTKLWQVLIPLGTVAQRSHWMAAVAGAITATAAMVTVWYTGCHRSIRGNPETQQEPDCEFGLAVGALVAGFSVALAADHWQHSIHLNSHIVTVALNAAILLLLTRWAHSRQNRWLYASCWLAGLGPTHHPLTVLGIPAYVLFVLLVRPTLFNPLRRRWWEDKDWQILLVMCLCVLLGLAVWLYYPIRSPMAPVFGPHDMNTLDGFLNVVLARGLKVNLFHFGWADQGQRLLVLWTLLRQQFSLPILLSAVVGLAWLIARQRRTAVLFLILLLSNLAFTINTVQDVMAYLLTPFMLVGTLAGVGAGVVVRLAARGARSRGFVRPAAASAAAFLLLWPLLALAQNLPHISLRGYSAGDDYVAAVLNRFEGGNEHAVLLNDWEHMTPLWYSRWVENRWPDPADVTPSLVSPDRPWLQRVFEHLTGGPVFLSGYRREIVDAGFRLRPDGVFYQVLEPGDITIPPGFGLLPAVGGQPVELLGYQLGQVVIPAGGLVQLDLAMRAPITTAEYMVPYVRVGEIAYRFTTDSHLLTPLWQAGEVVVERYEWALPLDLPAGQYPLRVGLANLSTDTESEPILLDTLRVTANRSASDGKTLDGLLANFGQRVGVDRVIVRGGGSRRLAVWQEPLVMSPGDSLAVTIKWRGLAPVEQSYTVFVHLMDGANRVWDQQDYTPLGGSYPTHLWIPKWLPGQTALDPYSLQIPSDSPPGDYYLEIGLYGMTTQQRIYQYDRFGNLVGDRLVLGWVQVR